MSRRRYPLGLKFLGWVTINLAVLLMPLLIFLGAAVGWRWEWVERSPLGERLRAMADSTIAELRNASDDEREKILEKRTSDSGLTFALFDLDGEQISGPDLELPADMQQKLRPPMPMSSRDFSKMPPPPPNEARPLGGEPPRRQEFHRSFIAFGGHPAPCWIGFRAMLRDPEDDIPVPVTLVVLVPSTWKFLSVFNFWILFFAMAGAFVISALLWLPLLRGITHTIGEIAGATRQFAEGRFTLRLKSKRRDELGSLAEDINSMAERLDQLVSAQRRFLGDAAHELGSPLARLQVSTAILEENPGAISSEMVADIREEVQLMSRLVEELLAYSRLETAPARPELIPLSLSEVWTRVKAREDRADAIASELPDELKVLSQQDLLERILANLARNCLRYAPGAPALLSAKIEGERVVVTLTDEGPGVPVNSLSRLGEPFFRPDAARTREEGGHGLGLAIVKSAAATIGATVEFRQNTPSGLAVILSLPRAS